MEGEVVYFRLTDVGRKIDIHQLSEQIPQSKFIPLKISRDTPKFVQFLEPLKYDISVDYEYNIQSVKDIKLQVKFYEDGVICLIARVIFTDLPLYSFHEVRKYNFKTKDGNFKINHLLKFHFQRIFSEVKPFIEEEELSIGSINHEKYVAFCITDEIENPSKFIKDNEDYLAKLLMGENPDLKLHETQIKSTLDHPFSFLKNDIIIFDFDRCILIDPNKDYDDLLIVLEIANYQLLELRILDHIVEKRLSLAGGDIRDIYFKRLAFLSKINKKVGNLMRLKYDLIFVLENIENVSKLFGDYFLAQTYAYLAGLFQLQSWSSSIRGRLDTLGDIYQIAQTNMNERILLIVEILLSFIFILEFIILVIDNIYRIPA